MVDSAGFQRYRGGIPGPVYTGPKPSLGINDER
jgi:hypothetical protein